MGAVRSAGVALVSALAAQALKDGTPRNACRAIGVLAALAHASHLLLRPPRGHGSAAGTRMIDREAAALSDEAVSELQAAHAAVRGTANGHANGVLDDGTSLAGVRGDKTEAAATQSSETQY